MGQHVTGAMDVTANVTDLILEDKRPHPLVEATRSVYICTLFHAGFFTGWKTLHALITTPILNPYYL